MKQYLELLSNVRTNGKIRPDRTGVGTVGLFGTQTKYDLTEGFPLITTKKMHTKSIIHELLWILSGDTNTKYLKDNGVRIWDEWSDQDGDLGRIYGHQWRNWNGAIDQIENLISGIIKDPYGRRHIVTSWNPSDLEKSALPPCHCFFQCYVVGNRLDLQLYQRSADLFLGVPFNIASYSILLTMIAVQCGYIPGTFTHTLGDAHIYLTHLDKVDLQLSREEYNLPILSLTKGIKDMTKYKYSDINIIGYTCHDTIKAKVAI